MIAPNLPTQDDLKPQLERLEETPGSVVLIALELPSTQNFCRIGVGFFNAEERKALRAALARCKKRREAKGNQIRVAT